MKTWMGAGIIALAAIAAVPAHAQDNNGFYIQLNAGIANVGDTDVTYFDDSDVYETSADLKSSVTFGGALGVDFGTVRGELAVDYARNKITGLTLESVNGSEVTLTPADIVEICDYLEADNCSGTGNTINVAGSRARQITALANLWLDLPIGETVVPYVGGGAGVGGFEVDGEGKAGFAWQAGAGVAFNVSKAVVLSADYRRRQVNGGDVDDGFSRVGKIKSNIISAGLRFRF